MESDASPSCRRPLLLLLLGRCGPSLAALAGCSALIAFFQVSASRDEQAPRLVQVLRPTAVVLDSAEFYLDGRRIHDALKRSSPETRVLFLDLEGPWALWIEMESEETGNLRIVPCETAQSGDALFDLLQEPGVPAPQLATSA